MNTAKEPKPHTVSQQAALHVWLRQCAEVAQANGYTFTHYLRDVAEHGIEIPVTEALMKEIYRTAYQATTGHESTTEASTTDYDPAYHAMILFFGERGMTLPPWPSRRGPL